MAINTSVYGSSEQWRDASFYDKFHRNKKAYFNTNQSQLGQGVSNGKLSYSQPIDKSLSYCCLGSESALSHIRYVQTVNNSATVIDSQDSSQTNFLFGEITTQTGMTGDYTNSQLSDFKYKKAWQANFDTDTWWSDNKNKLVEPYTTIHPKSVVFLIYVIAANSNFSDSINVTLSEYRTRYTNYPNISQVYIVPFMNTALATENSPSRADYGAGGNNTSNNRQGFCLGLLDEYEIPSRNFSMYSYQLTWKRIVMGNLYQSDTTEYSTATAIVYVPENVGEHFKHQRVNIYDYYYIRTYIEYYDGIFDEILKTVACFGLYFTEKTNVATYGTFTDPDMYIGVLSSDGAGHGEYLRGTATTNAPQNQWTDMSESGYDYKKPVDPNSYSKETSLPIAAMGSSYKYYLPLNSSGSAVLSMLEEIANYPDPQDSWIFDRQFVFQEPIECILAWRHIHLKPPDVSGQTPSHLKLGWFVASENTSQGYIYGGECARVKIAEIDIFPHYGDFRDYEPYSTYAIYVPFCGIKELPTSTFMGHKLNLYLNKNYRTGDVEALIFCDNIYWGNMHGNASIELPLSGKQSAEYIKRRMELQNASDNLFGSTLSSILGNAAGATISSAHGNPGGAAIQAFAGAMNLVNGIAQYTQIKTELEHTPNKIVNIQKGSSSTSILSVMNPYILILRPKFSNGYNEELFAKTRGFATLENRMKNSLKGYSECENPILDGIPCTDTERKLIVQALEEGCIFDTNKVII